MALQTSLNLRPGQILPHGFAQTLESTQSYPHPFLHPDYPQPDSDWHCDWVYPQQKSNRNHSRHVNDSTQAGPPTSESRSLLERPIHPQKAPLVLHSEGSLYDFPTMASASSSTDMPQTRQRTPSPTAATDNSDEDDTGFAIGMALMSVGQNNSDTAADSATFVGIGGESNSPVPIKIGLHEPTGTNEDSPPPYAPDFLQTSTSQIAGSLLSEQEPTSVGWNHMEESWDTPSDMPQFRPFSDQVHSSYFVANSDPASPTSLSRHTSWHPWPSQVTPPQPYARFNVQPPPPPQQYVDASNSGLNRSPTYTLGFSGSSPDRRIPVPASLKSIDRTRSHSGLRGRESDKRSVQQSVMTNSNVSGRSQGGNPRRNRYLPKHLVMPAPLQPMMQNQVTTQQVRFDSQVNVIYPLAQAPSSFHAKVSTSNTQRHRAQEIPIAQSNGKLCKRSSLFGRIKESPQPPVTAESFSANIVTAHRHARGAEKVHRKVLKKK